MTLRNNHQTPQKAVEPPHIEIGNRGVDVRAALAEWRASSAAGDSRSMLALGRAHVRGLGVAQDYVEAQPGGGPG